MKRYLTMILAAGAVLALQPSCSVKEENPLDSNEVTLFYGRAYDTATKIYIGDPYTESEVTYYKGLWESGDQIKVYRISDGAHLGNATLVEGAGTQSGTFSLKGTIGGDDVRIVYGENTLPSEQTQEEGGTNSFKDYGFAYSGITNAANGNNFTLTHVPAYVKVTVKAASTSDTWYGYNVDAVTLRVPGANLSGDFSVDYDNGEITPGQNASDYVTVELDTPLNIGTSEQEIWLAALPSDLTGCLVTVSLSLSKDASNTHAMVKFTGKQLLPNSVNTLRITSMQSIISPGDPAAATEYGTVSVYAKHNGESWSYYTTRILSGMNRMDKLLVDTRDPWGGYKGVKPDHITSTNSDGYWRTGTYHGRPMFVDPDGNISFLYGVNAVTPDPLSDAADSHTTDYYNSKFASEYEWAAWCADNLANKGFNFFSTNPRRIRNYRMDPTIGLGISATVQERLHAGNHQSLLSQTENMYFLRTFLWDYNTLTQQSFATDYDSPFILMFDPLWQEYINTMAVYASKYFKDDPNFIGYYTDNELPFCDTNNTYKQGISLQNFLDQENEYYRCSLPAYNWALQWMQDNYGTTTYDASMEEAFVKAVAEYYFRTTAEAIRAADPQHLVMGCRLHSTAEQTQGIVEACARYHDVITLNFYLYWDISSFAPLANIKSWAGGKPVVFTEFYVKNDTQTAPDATAYNNNEGAGGLVKSQTARGQFYQNNVIRFIEDGTIAGWQWFKWTDDYRSSLPGWVNKGLVVPDYSSTYVACTNLMKAMNWNLYQCLDYYWGAPENSGITAGDLPEGTWE